MDRSRTSKALAKAVAYVNCGKPDRAVEWVAALLSDFAAEGVDVEYAFHFSAAMVPVDEPVEEITPTMDAAASWLGGRLIKREGSVQL